MLTDNKIEIRNQIQHSNQDKSATELTKNNSSQQGMENEDSFLATVGLYAQNLYENMKENTQHWLSSLGQQPSSSPPENSKWRDLIAHERNEKDKDISL